MSCGLSSSRTELSRWMMTQTPSLAMVWAASFVSSPSLSARETMPRSATPEVVSLMPREEPPDCTSMRTPGWEASYCLAASATSGATVLDPVAMTVSDVSLLPQPTRSTAAKKAVRIPGRRKSDNNPDRRCRPGVAPSPRRAGRASPCHRGSLPRCRHRGDS